MTIDMNLIGRLFCLHSYFSYCIMYIYIVYVNLSVYLSSCLLISPPVYLSIFLTFCLSNYLSLAAEPSVYLPVCLSAQLSNPSSPLAKPLLLMFNRGALLSICLCDRLSSCLSFYLSVCV